MTSQPCNGKSFVQPQKKFGHRNGRSSCAHSIGKFFLCYIVLFSFETSATGSPGNYLYMYFFKVVLYQIGIFRCGRFSPSHFHFGIYHRLVRQLDPAASDAREDHVGTADFRRVFAESKNSRGTGNLGMLESYCIPWSQSEQSKMWLFVHGTVQVSWSFISSIILIWES